MKESLIDIVQSEPLAPDAHARFSASENAIGEYQADYPRHDNGLHLGH